MVKMDPSGDDPLKDVAADGDSDSEITGENEIDPDDPLAVFDAESDTGSDLEAELDFDARLDSEIGVETEKVWLGVGTASGVANSGDVGTGAVVLAARKTVSLTG